MGFYRGRDEFEDLSELLSSERPTPSESFERELLSRVPAGARRGTARPVLAALVTLVVAGGIAASGGASFAVNSATHALATATSGKSGGGGGNNGNGSAGSASQQYGTGSCVGNVNPSGNHIPNAGTGTGHSGQNPDGFYLIGTSSGADVEVIDLSNGVVIGTFPSGSVIKVTQASAKNPQDSYQKIGGNGANAVTAHVFAGGDVEIVPVDGGTPNICLVPKPPK
jgi:hypothetical protein